MNITESIFKAYDIRGKVHSELTKELAQAVGRALADFLPEKGAVAVGRDMRPDSAELAENVRLGLIAQGRNVIDIGQVTSDMIYFAVGHLGLAGGAMVTASHNPGEYNGIKLCREGAAPIGAETGLLDIRDAVKADNYRPALELGEAIEKNIVDDWIDHALTFADTASWPAYQIAVDAGNGMAGAIVPHLEGKTPLQITPMYFELDGTFPNHPANPLVLENLHDLIAQITDNQLDFGMAFDGDGDRAFLVDETGRQVSGTVMTAMIARAQLAKHPGATILYNAICGRVVAETIKEFGGIGIRTQVGHSNIKTAIREHGAVFAGEHSGHYYFKDNYQADSGLIGALVAIDVLAKSGGKLSELVNHYTRYSQSGEINSTVQDKEVVLAKLAEHYVTGQQDTLDGLTVNYPDWWFNVRPSNTEPLLRLNVEAKDEATMATKRDELLQIIRG